MNAAPGQFVLLWLPGVDEKPFSVSGVDDAWIEITIKAVGPFTRAMMDVTEGTRLGLRGPFGHGFELRDPAILLGGGCGIAPIRYLADKMDKEKIDFDLLLGVRTKSDLMFCDHYRESDAWLVSDDGSLEHKGLVTDRLAEILKNRPTATIFAAGPEAMLLAIREIANTKGIPYQLSFERYMKCGIGLCGHCAMDGSGIRLCVEGPVLSEEDLQGITDMGLPHRDATGARREIAGLKLAR